MKTDKNSVRCLSDARVLVVEDDPFIAMDLQDILAAHGAEVLGPVPTVPAALAAIGAERPNAVLLDVNLRGTKSVPVAAALRAAGIPFVLVTGYSRSQLDEPEMREVPIIPKPVTVERLVQVLRELISAG
jgi:CheY-like chemotaxis protein